MILTVTINPLLERRFLFKKISFGCENRNGDEKLSAGGKGINVSRQLNCLNTENVSLTFLGGYNGKLFKDIVLKEGIKAIPIRILNETREAIVLFDESIGKITTLFSPNSQVLSGEVDAFMNKMGKMIENCEIVVFSGSSSCKETDIIFPFGIETANKFDKISICDTYGTHLKDCIEKSPTIIHNNVSETEKSLNFSMKTEKEKLEFLEYFYGNGIKQSYLTNGELKAYASNFDFHYEIEVPKIHTVDSTGSGDGFVAGIAYALHNDLTFEEGLAFASSIGVLNAKRLEVCNISMSEIEEIKASIRISPIGKKMKTLDVTPC
ncbi:MAG: PfkB family carbohydrate kinase [Ignavibacteriaceae bacterium]|jgi:1-phosphofructokinase family hexose kinase